MSKTAKVQKQTSRPRLRIAPSDSRQLSEARRTVDEAVSSPQQVQAQRDHALTRESGHASHNLVGMIHAETGQYKLLSRDEEREVSRAARAGDKSARETLILANLRLVTSFARYYRDRGVEHPDLIQEGMLGLMKAVDGYDPETGYAFSTYALNWVRQSMQRAVMDKGRLIRVPVYMRERQAQLRAIATRLEDALGRLPTDGEIAQEANATSAPGLRGRTLDVGQVREALHGVPLEPRLFSAILTAQEGDDLELGSLVFDPEAQAALEAVEDEADRALALSRPDSVTGIMARLKATGMAREMEIVERYTLQGQSLHEIGHDLHLSHERVRQLRERGKARIREERERAQRRMGRQTARREKGGAA